MNNSIFPYLPGQAPGQQLQLPTSGLGVLAANPGMMSMFSQAMPQMPTMPADNFDPRKALMGGALMDISKIILGENPQNGPLQAYQMGKQMYDKERMQKYQQELAKYQGEQQNFKNTLGVGQLIATLAKDTSPNDVKLMRSFGLDPTNPADVEKFYKIANQGKGTNVTVDNSQAKGVQKGFEVLAKPKSEELATFDTQAGNMEPIDILGQLQLINQQIPSSGFLGDLGDTAQGVLDTAGVSFKVNDQTSWRDLYKSLSTKLALNELQAFKGPTTDFEFGKAESVNGSLSASQAGRSLIIESALASHMGKQAFAGAYAQWGYNELAQGRIPLMTNFKKTDQYRELAENTIFAQNPNLMVEYRNNLDDKTWDNLVEMRGRQIQKLVDQLYPDLDVEDRELKAQEILDMEMRGL